MSDESASPGEADDDLVDGLSARRLGALNLTGDTACAVGAAGPRPALSPEELAPHFPQLEILECLGRGGMGVVYKARQKSLNRLVALKLLAPERAGDPAFALRFEKEAQALAALSHPNIVAIHDFGEAGGFYFLLMEYIDGVNLRQLLATRRLSPREALAIVPPVCEALQCAHERGIVHRDIKPENLLIDKSGAVKIADFGIAKMLDVAAETPGSAAEGPGSLPLGTPGYAAPEQTEGHADHRADIYSLGVVLYEMLTGERPKNRIEAPSRRVRIDIRIDEIVLRALERQPGLRFATAAEFRTQVEALTTIADGRQAAARPPGLLKVSTSTLSTPTEIGTMRGQFRIYRTRGQLILDDRRLSHARDGRTTVIPLASIRDVSLGRYPRSMNAAGVSMVSLTYEEGGERKQVLLSPMEGWFAFPSTWNARAADWHAAIRAAVNAATGEEPETTPADRLVIPGGFPWSLVLPVVPLLAGLGLYLTLLRPTGAPFPAPVLFFGILAMTFLGAAFVFPWAMGRRGRTDTQEKEDRPEPANRSKWNRVAMVVLLAPLVIHFGSLALRAISPDAGPDLGSGSDFFPLPPEMLILATLSALLYWFWSGSGGTVRWHHQVALAGVWWFLSLPVLFWLADVPRIQNTQELALWLMVGAVPLLLVLAKRQLRRWQATPNGMLRLRAWSWVGWSLAVPAIGFAAFFIRSMANESGGWHPSSGEALAVPLIGLAALVLPSCSAVLWRAADGGRKSFVFMAMAALSAISAVVLGSTSSRAARPWALHSFRQDPASKVDLTPEAGEGRVGRARKALPPPEHIDFRVLRVENPPGTRNILLHFERDSNYGLAIEVGQDVTRLQGGPGPAPDQRDWRQKEWVGVQAPRMLRWVLPQEFTPDEAKALAKEMERKWKGSRTLPDGAVPEFATAPHRDGWRYHLVAKVLREPGSPRPPEPVGALFTAGRRIDWPADALVRLTLDQSANDGPKTRLGEELVFKTAPDRATGFVLRWHAYPAPQGKFGNPWILDLVDPDTGVIFHRVEHRFALPVKLTSPEVPPLPRIGAAGQMTESGARTPFRLLHAEESAAPGAASVAWWDVFATVEHSVDRPEPAFQMKSASDIRDPMETPKPRSASGTHPPPGQSARHMAPDAHPATNSEPPRDATRREASISELLKQPPDPIHDPETGFVIVWSPAGAPPVRIEASNDTIRAWQRHRRMPTGR